MSSEIQARGPLDGRQIQANGVRLAGLPSAALVNVRGPIADAAIDKALKRVIGCQRPTRPNSIEVGKAGRILWLGPGRSLTANDALECSVDRRIVDRATDIN